MSTLIVVDIQYDFMPGGALGVNDGDAVVPVINRRMRTGDYDRIVATQDWHPPDHGSFSANHPGTKPGEIIQLEGLEQLLWPVHCVQNTRGAELHADLEVSRIERVFVKGDDPRYDSYSGFFDNGHIKGTGLHEYLQERGVTDVDLAGLATDYCVKFTALDAVRLGYQTRVWLDGCRGVELQPGDIDRAVAEMRAAGVEVVE